MNFIIHLFIHLFLPVFREVVLKLLQFEASTNTADSKGCSPLHLAAWRGDVDIVRILIHHGPSHCRVNQQVTSSNNHLLKTHFFTEQTNETSQSPETLWLSPSGGYK